MQFCPTASKVASRGAILLSVRAPVGTLNMADQEYGIGRGLCAIVPSQDVLTREFAYSAIFTCKGQLLVNATGSTYDSVSAWDVGDMLIPLPPLSEQEQIVNFIIWETAAIDSAIDQAHRQLDRISEYRTRLIADVVTGKLDVRGAELPELEETAVLDDVDESEDVADLAEETGEVQAIEEENGD